MKTKCYKIKLKKLESISAKCYLAEDYSGNKAFIPKSQILGYADENAYYIPEYILNGKSLMYSTKEAVYVDKYTHRISPVVEYEHHIPQAILPVEVPPHVDLIR